ncbi:MAG: single-stranded-DNA-specific exonuclease RecJ, partial [Lachnospiraceae bacterium]
MKNTQWMIYTTRADFNALAARFSVSPILARIMINRGVLPEEFGDYLGGSLAELPDARLLRDIDRAADILLEKRDRGRRVR